jgi:large repetitive protein
MGLAFVPVLAAAFCVVTASASDASPAPTVTTLTSSAPAPVTGQSVTFTATVAEAPPGSGGPSGTVTFEFTDPAASCTGSVLLEPLVGGVAQCTTTNLVAAQSPVGVTAAYGGDPTDAASTSSEFQQSVASASTSVSVSSNAVHVPFNGTGCTTTAGSVAVNCSSVSGITAGASVSDANFDDAIPPGTTVATVSHMSMTLTNAATLSETGDTLSFLNDPNSTLGSGRPGLFTATIAPVSPGTGTPSGTVTWTITGADSSQPVCANGTIGVVNRRTLVEQCRIPQGVLAASGSPYVVSVAYSGDGSYAASTGTFNQVVTPATTRTFVAGTRLPLFPSTNVGFTASVVPSVFGGPPTGSVTFNFTALPVKINGCTLSSTSPNVTCAQGNFDGVGAGYVASDLTVPGAIAGGMTVLSLRAGVATLSANPASSLTGQQLLFTPAGSGIPTISCSGGNTIAYVQTGPTCTVPATNGFVAGAVWGLVVGYSGDVSDASSSSHQLKLVVQ